MMNINKKILAIVLILLYIFANMLFYTVIFNDYVNRKVFFITGFQFLCEITFWIVIFHFLNKERDIPKADKILIEGIFLTGIVNTGIGRVLLNSSPYVNDLLNNNTALIYFLGIGRVLMIFGSILFIFYAVKKNKFNLFLTLISVFNLIIAFFIWGDFDNSITSSFRIIMGLLGIGYILFFNEKSINKKAEEKNEKEIN